jgi:hypothetical protein
MTRAATFLALLALAGCASTSDEPSQSQRNHKRGWFYEPLRPESSRKAELKAKAERPGSVTIDESYDVGQIRSARQYSEFVENYELRDWKEGVLVTADADLLRKMKADSTAKVGTLQTKLAGLERQDRPLQKGLVEPVRQQLDTERMKLSEIDRRLASME